MGFKRKQDTSQGEVIKFENVGDAVTGVYLGSFDHEGEYGPTKKHLFKTEKGTRVIFGQKHLTDLLAEESPGQLVRVTFAGLKKGKKGNPMKMYTLDIDDEYIASEEEIAVAVDANTSDYGDDDDDTASDEKVTAPAKSQPTATSPDAARQKRVQDLLNKSRQVKTAS